MLTIPPFMIRPLLFCFLALSLLVRPARGIDQELRRSLEHVYSEWRSAIASHDYATWQHATASFRQVMTRNMIVSQMQPFPGALFDIPLHPPDTGLLHLVKTETNGPTAYLIYFGKVDLGISDPSEVPENLMVLSYIKEGAAWKFDTTRLVNLANAPDVRTQLKNTGTSPFLNEPDLSPSGVLPAIPALCRAPDHIALLQIVSVGYETTAKVNQFDLPTVTDNGEQHLIIGGLNDGDNPLKLSIKTLELPKDVKHQLSVKALILTGYESRPSIKVFEWEPSGYSVPAEVDLQIPVNRLTMKGI